CTRDQRNDYDAYCHGQPRADTHETRPRIFHVRLRSNLREDLWYINGELVRGRVLAGVIALGAVVAEVRKVVDVGFAECLPALHSGEDGAIAFAVPAGVADHHQAFAFGDQIIERPHEPPPSPRCVRTPTRSSCQAR